MNNPFFTHVHTHTHMHTHSPNHHLHDITTVSYIHLPTGLTMNNQFSNISLQHQYCYKKYILYYFLHAVKSYPSFAKYNAVVVGHSRE